MNTTDTSNRPGKLGMILGIGVFTASLFMVEQAISMVTTPLNFATDNAAPGTPLCTCYLATKKRC